MAEVRGKSKNVIHLIFEYVPIYLVNGVQQPELTELSSRSGGNGSASASVKISGGWLARSQIKSSSTKKLILKAGIAEQTIKKILGLRLVARLKN